jgi:hypothetical protein
MIIEGEDALERVASLLRSSVGQPGRLEVLAEAIRSQRPDLTRKLLREVERMGDPDPAAATDRLLNRGRHDPDSFMAGAIVGFALGGVSRLDLDPERRSDETEPGADPEDRRAAGVVETAQDAQTGSGGLGSLDTGQPPSGKG